MAISREEQLTQRHRQGKRWSLLFQLSILIAMIALTALLYNVLNQSFGLVAIENEIEPATLMVGDTPLEEMDNAQLITILESHLSKGLVRRIESDKALASRSQADLYQLVLQYVVEPTIVGSWDLSESLFERSFIEAEIGATHPNATLQFHSWISSRFVRSSQSSKPEIAGIRTAIFGSLWIIAITIFFSVPVGVGAAIYLEEYANDDWINRILMTNISNLAGIPSIIYGMLGLAIFVRTMGNFTSGQALGIVNAAANGRTILSAGLTLGLLILPIIIINSQEAIRAVPSSLRQASYGLGATQWQTIWYHVLPAAIPGILTGTILAVSRAIGETAPLVVVGAATFITVDPSNPFAQFTTLPIQIYQWTSRPQAEFHHLAAGAIIVLLIILLSLNATAVLLRNRYRKAI